MIALKQRIPIRAPDHLDHIPSRAAEHALKLVDDALVPAHRPIQPLQIAVHDKDQVVQLLPRTQRDRAQRIDLIRLAIADKRPDLAIRLLESARDSRGTA